MKLKITFLLFAVFSLSISAQTVNIEGDPYTGNPYATITDAITAANNGDVILITGVHTEVINIDKSITLRGTDPTTDIIQADASAGTATDRVIGLGEGALTITIENLGVQHGNASANGGGINVEKVTGLVTLKNLIVKDNSTSANGGGITAVGSNVDIIECAIVDNTSGSAGGGLMLVSNNAGGAGIDSVINIKQSLINNNSANNGGGIYLNGNPGFGQNYTVTANIENTTISNNTGTNAGGSAPGGGAIWAKAANHSPGGSASGNGNTILQLVHTTVYNNTHASALNKGGLQFTSGGTFETFLSAYNSIIVGNDDLATGPKAINFANVELTEMINCILGGLINATAGDTGIIDDGAKNNQKGKTASESGLTGTLTDEGGNTLVLSITESSAADDFCTAATGITLPTVDQRGYTREGVVDAGAFEFGGILSTGDLALKDFGIKVYPNPARELVNISSKTTINSVKIYSILGSLEKEVYDTNTFNVSSLSSGMHVMLIETEKQSVVKRLIVE